MIRFAGAKTVVLLVGMILLGSAVADEPRDHSSSIGTWKLNLKESIAPQGRQFNPYTVVLRRADDMLDFSYYGVREGKPFNFVYTAKADGVVRDLEHGIKAAMIRLPSGNYEARLWLPDGTYENKFCQLAAGGQQQICLATVTEPDGSVVFFKQVQDRQ
ncbi:MAG: hypothetical protein NAOJABEB_01807 [Steroidobacteraceae bacterium]|nr:hypothetical protein [Steroidobacteraceae bacterium]